MPAPAQSGRGMTTSDQLARHARKIPDEIALRFAGTGRSYRELDERVSRLANALAERGVSPGDRIAVLGRNGPEIVESYFAAARLGAICVPVNFRLVADEVAYVLADSGARAVIVDELFTGLLAKSSDVDIRLVVGESGDYETALATASPARAEIAVDEQSPAFIMYTSGTTGRPKGAVLSHQNLLMHTFSSAVHHGITGEDKAWLVGVPLFHIAGVSGMLPYLLQGGRIVIAPSGRFDPAETAELLARERITACFLVPAQWQAICDLPDLASYDLAALRRITWGAAPASTTLLRAMFEKFPDTDITTAFGQTECSPVTTVLRGEDALRKIGSVGTPMLNVEVRIVDEDMHDVPPGEVGEIVYRGPTVMREYWGKPAETAEAFRGGWFHSGDLVRQDEDGYLYVVDRKKDMIISGGENIYCAEIEDVLAAHPKIAEVALIGVPDERWGETPLAVVGARDAADPPSPGDIADWCRDRLAGYKRPRRLAVVAELPRNPSGKVLKTQLRAEHAAGRLTVQE